MNMEHWTQQQAKNAQERTTMARQLRPCPLCGEEIETYSITMDSERAIYMKCRCQNGCQTEFELFPHAPLDAIEVWNNRREGKTE